jgi:guanylate kinase
MPDAQFVFLTPPSWEELERRLIGRGTESREVIQSRLDRARIELAAEGEFDVVVVNDDVRRAAAELVASIEAVCPSEGPRPPEPASPQEDQADRQES